jgi:hypothetical protein
MAYFISRQRDYSDNCLYIEIAVSKKNAGIDVLTPRYVGEQKNLVDPRDAITIAEKMYRQWEHDYFDEPKRLRIVGIPTPLVYDCTTKGFASAKIWADKTFANMKKCGECRKAMGNRDPYEHEDLSNLVFCSEYCASKKYRDTYGVDAGKILSKKDKLIKQVKK